MDKMNMVDLRKLFDEIYPTAKNLHMNIVAAVLFSTDYDLVYFNSGIHVDANKKRRVMNGCRALLRA